MIRTSKADGLVLSTFCWGGSLVTSLALLAEKPAVAAVFSAGQAMLPCGSCVCVCACSKEGSEFHSFLVGFETVGSH